MKYYIQIALNSLYFHTKGENLNTFRQQSAETINARKKLEFDVEMTFYELLESRVK